MGLTDGWVSSSDTWTFATASTFTIAGVDRTTTYTKGTRLRFTQTTVKYAVVVASSFSTNTTVTIAVNNDYTIANAAISANSYSYEANPQGYPTWFNYTPTYTGYNGAVTTLLGRFAIVGSSCTLILYFTGTSNQTFLTATAPVAAVSDVIIAICYVQNSGAGQATPGRAVTSTGSAVITFGKDVSGAAFANTLAKGADVTMTMDF